MKYISFCFCIILVNYLLVPKCSAQTLDNGQPSVIYLHAQDSVVAAVYQNNAMPAINFGKKYCVWTEGIYKKQDTFYLLFEVPDVLPFGIFDGKLGSNLIAAGIKSDYNFNSELLPAFALYQIRFSSTGKINFTRKRISFAAMAHLVSQSEKLAERQGSKEDLVQLQKQFRKR
jgi:hypothetical protein